MTTDSRGRSDYTYDVIVVGAGVAGLAAARGIAGAGRTVLLVEARDRAGGRILTSPDGVELGAEFVHGTPASTLSLLSEAGSHTIGVKGEHWISADGHLERMGGDNDQLHEVISHVAALRSDMSVEAFLHHTISENPKLRDGADSVRLLVEGFDAADPRRASIRAIATEWAGDATFESGGSRPEGGYPTLVNHMMRRLDPTRVEQWFASVARAVRWNRRVVEVDIERRNGGGIQQARARALVVTVPLAVLQASADDPAYVRFDPPLLEKRGPLDRLATGPVLKVLLRFREPFWERVDGGRYTGTSFFHTNGAVPFQAFWTQLPAHTCWLTAWVGGPRAEAMSSLSNDVIQRRAVESLQTVFGQRVNVGHSLQECRVHNWQRDPFARGAYSYLLVGGEGARRELATPLAETLFFAGEATDDTAEAGTVASAIESGERAAREVIA